MRELLKLFATRYGSTRVEVAMEMSLLNKKYFFFTLDRVWGPTYRDLDQVSSY